MASGSKGRQHIMEKAITARRSAAAQATIVVTIPGSSLSALLDTLSGLAAHSSRYAGMRVAFLPNAMTPAQAAELITLTSLKAGSRRSVVKSGRARSGSASSKKA